MPRVAIAISALAVLLVAAAPEPASAGNSIRISRIVPGAAVSGAAIAVRGAGLSGKGTRVTVGGKKAKILSARKKELRIVVPRAKTGLRQLVVRRGRQSTSSRIRVLRPFSGTIGVTPDRARSAKRTIGPAGGVVEARGRDGSRYALSVPAGALTKEEAITVTPVREFRGLPFTGLARGADLGPDGLVFATPATLTITSKRPFPRAVIGFGYTSGGGGLEVQGAKGSGRVRRLQIEHFTTEAVAGTSPADFVNAVAPLLVEQPMREDVIDRVIALIGAYEAQFPPAFCSTQPDCGAAVQKALDSLDTRIQGRCSGGPQNAPTLSAVRDVIRMEALRHRLGATDDSSVACREEILRGVFEPAKAAACGAGGNPLGGRAAVGDILPENGGGGDIDRDGELTHLEFMFFMIGPLQTAGLDALAGEAQDCALATLARLPDEGKALCESDRGNAERSLKRALDYAQALNQVLQPYVDALDFCRIALAVVPASVTLQPGAQQQFGAGVTGVLDTSNNSGVTWSATRGTVDAAGFYTAPSTPGGDQVTVTSVINPARKAIAAVTVAGCVNITGSFSNGHSQADSDFAMVQKTVNYGSGSVRLAGDCAGTASLTVDDGIVVEVTPPGGSLSSFSHDFSGGCSGTITAAGPFDLTSLFGSGNNSAKFRFRDLCGQGGSGSSDIFLVFGS